MPKDREPYPASAGGPRNPSRLELINGQAPERLFLVRLIFGVGDVLGPFRVRSLVFSHSFGHGQMSHVVVGGRAVPVPFARGSIDNVAGANFDDLASRDWARPTPSVT